MQALHSPPAADPPRAPTLRRTAAGWPRAARPPSAGAPGTGGSSRAARAAAATPRRPAGAAARGSRPGRSLRGGSQGVAGSAAVGWGLAAALLGRGAGAPATRVRAGPQPLERAHGRGGRAAAPLAAAAARRAAGARGCTERRHAGGRLPPAGMASRAGARASWCEQEAGWVRRQQLTERRAQQLPMCGARKPRLATVSPSALPSAPPTLCRLPSALTHPKGKPPSTHQAPSSSAPRAGRRRRVAWRPRGARLHTSKSGPPPARPLGLPASPALHPPCGQQRGERLHGRHPWAPAAGRRLGAGGGSGGEPGASPQGLAPHLASGPTSSSTVLPLWAMKTASGLISALERRPGGRRGPGGPPLWERGTAWCCSAGAGGRSGAVGTGWAELSAASCWLLTGCDQRA